MPTSTSLPLPLRPLQNRPPLSMTTLSQRTSPSSSARALALTSRSSRPQRQAATIARKRVVDAYALYPIIEADPDADRDGSQARPSAPRHTVVGSSDSDGDGDSDVFVQDSESDCPRLRKVARGKKRKKGVSPMMDGRGRRMFKAGKVLRVGDRKRKESATGFMVKSGTVVKDVLRWKDILRGKTGRGPRDAVPLWEPVERGQGEYRDIVRRAGLNDMGPAAGSYRTKLAG